MQKGYVTMTVPPLGIICRHLPGTKHLCNQIEEPGFMHSKDTEVFFGG